MRSETNDMITLGWREWVHLPELKLRNIKAKVDTGARTSALHAFEVRPFDRDGRKQVEFKIHPHQRDNETVIVCTADVIDERVVRDSGGRQEKRWVIMTPVVLGEHNWSVEFTLTARDDMMFRMLLGRSAFRGLAVVDASRSYLVGKRRKKKKSSHDKK
jgi:hypothetical protein